MAGLHRQVGALITAIVALSQSVAADDWPQFRGPGAAGVAEIALPADWSVETGENVAWEVDTPARGVSCPIVVGGKVILTCSGGLDRTRLHVVAYDSQTGRQLWHRQAWAAGRTNCHPSSAVAANTPASDGQRVFALYSSNDLICLDMDGNIQWIRTLTQDHPGVGNDVGMASSPVVSGEVVIVKCECQQGSFAAGYDVATGEKRWQVERPGLANWSSPVGVQYAGAKRGVVLQSGEDLTLLDSASGEVVWTEPIHCAGISSAVSSGRRLFVPADQLIALDVRGEKPEVVWRSSKLNPGSPSPVVAGDSVYTISGAGILLRGDVTTGDPVWRKRLGGSFWASPLLSGGKLYCINARGDTFVVSAESGEILSEPKFGQPISASPVAADGGMFVRSNEKLWKIAVLRQAARRVER